MKPGALLKPFLFSSLAFLLFSGTTTVVKEGDKEVGRFENHDGKTGIEFVQSEKKEVPLQPPRSRVSPSASIPSAKRKTAIEDVAILTEAQRQKLEESVPSDERKIYFIWGVLILSCLGGAWISIWIRRNR